MLEALLALYFPSFLHSSGTPLFLIISLSQVLIMMLRYE
jgi:hypothetical protein